ncbi:hypothetical protein JCM1840_000032 [Sporobolomyces johnsonii]
MNRQREPPTDAPPSYARFIPSRAAKKDLRPAVLLVSAFSSIYGIVAGAAVLHRRSDDSSSIPAKLSTVYLVLAILYFFCAAIELFGFAAAWRSSIRLVRSYFWGSATVAVVVTAAEIMRVVVHFTDKADIINTCESSYSSDISNGTATSADVTSYCTDQWQNNSYVDIALLLFSFFLSFFFASLTASYLHQLQNPQLLRTHAPTLAASSQYAPTLSGAYPLQPYPSSSSAVPAYPGPTGPYRPPSYAPGQLPTYDNPYGVALGAEKDDGSGAGAGGGAAEGTKGDSPFADYVERMHDQRGMPEQTTLLVRRPGEGVEEFETRQAEHEAELERRRVGAYGESTETVTLEAGRRV